MLIFVCIILVVQKNTTYIPLSSYNLPLNPETVYNNIWQVTPMGYWSRLTNTYPYGLYNTYFVFVWLSCTCHRPGHWGRGGGSPLYSILCHSPGIGNILCPFLGKMQLKQEYCQIYNGLILIVSNCVSSWYQFWF